MAKTKLVESKKNDNFILDGLIEKYGNIIYDYSDVINVKKELVSVSPSVDFCLGGGVQSGDLFLLAGPAKGGKTTTMLQMASNGNEKYGKKIFFANIEARLTARSLKGIHNLKEDNFKVIQSNSDKILTGEEHLSIIENIIKTHPNSIVLVDSLSAICPESESTDILTGQFRAGSPRLFSAFCKRIRQILTCNNVILCGTLHMMASMNTGYGRQTMSDGGYKLKYNSDVFLEIRYIEPYENGTEQIGQKIHWQCSWASLGPPNRKAIGYIRYNYGLDNIMENIEFGVQLGLIGKAGSWFSLGDIKCQGQEKLRSALLEAPESLKSLELEVKNMLV